MGQNMFTKTHQWLGAILLAGLLIGCGDEITSPSVSAQTTDNLKVNDSKSKRLTVSDSGIGPITAESTFNIHVLTHAFPNFSVVEQLNFQEGESFPIITISKGAKTLMTINPTLDLKSIYSVVVEDNLISNSLNHRLGTLFSDIYTESEDTYNCQPGVEEMSGKVLCLPPSASNMLYLFTGKWSGPDGEMPPTSILHGWALEAIIWKP